MTTTLDQTEIAENGPTYTNQFLGRRAIFTTYEGARIEGTITEFRSLYPIITFDDGRWARLDSSIEFVDA